MVKKAQKCSKFGSVSTGNGSSVKACAKMCLTLNICGVRCCFVLGRNKSWRTLYISKNKNYTNWKNK